MTPIWRAGLRRARVPGQLGVLPHVPRLRRASNGLAISRVARGARQGRRRKRCQGGPAPIQEIRADLRKFMFI